MSRVTIAAAAFALAMIVVGIAAGRWVLERFLERDVEPATVAQSASDASTAGSEEDPGHGLLYGRVATKGGDVYEGRLRFGGVEEALWVDTFNGYKEANPWAAHVPAERLKERRPIEVLGFELGHRDRPIELGRQLVARFGDVARIEVRGRELQVTLKSGTLVHLDRYDADDVADGLRVWDASRGVVDLDERKIVTIELLPTPPLVDAPAALHGTVRTRQRDFTGFVQWESDCVGSDVLAGSTAEGELVLRFDAIGSIARGSDDGSLVTLLDGRELALSGRDLGYGNRGIVVHDPRYGRVRVSWEAFERVDFDSGASAPAYGDFPPGRPLLGSVGTIDGHRFAGRLVFDLDESETTELLDAPSQGVDYAIPFGRIASIVPRVRDEGGVERATLTLHGGEELQLERAGDLDQGNAGMLIFVDGRQSPEYVPWSEVERVDFDP